MEESISGGKVIYYGTKEEKPCGIQILGKDDFGNKTAVDFEVYECDDVGIRKVETAMPGATLPGLKADEIVKSLIKGFDRCGCKVRL